MAGCLHGFDQRNILASIIRAINIRFGHEINRSGLTVGRAAFLILVFWSPKHFGIVLSR